MLLDGGVSEVIEALDEDYNSLRPSLANISNIATKQVPVTFDVLLDVVLAGKRPDCPNDSNYQVVRGSRSGVIKLWIVCWIGSLDDGRILVSRAAGQALPQLFSDKWHEGVNHCKGTLKACVKSILGRASLLCSTLENEGLGVFLCLP